MWTDPTSDLKNVHVNVENKITKCCRSVVVVVSLANETLL